MNDQSPIVIIGGGPAGSSIASYFALNKIPCLVLEKESFPRHHIGESLVPAANIVFQDIGFLEKLNQAGFPKKKGAAWTTPNQKIYSDLFSHYPAAGSLLGVADFCQTGPDILKSSFHVRRDKFDKLLLDHARELGAQVREQAKVVNVEFHPQHACVSYQDQAGIMQVIETPLVVDASGQQTVLGKQLRIKTMDPDFYHIAIYNHFVDYHRPDAHQDAEYIYIHTLPKKHSWFWEIPLCRDTTSIGLVTTREAIKNAPTPNELEGIFTDFLNLRPELAARFAPATASEPWRKVLDYSYSMDQVAGDRYVLIGDAARFVDPIFSSGVSVALRSARAAALDIINAYQQNGHLNSLNFASYEKKIETAITNWRRFIRVFYRYSVLFTYFINHDNYRNQIIALLQGELYETTHVPVLDEMERMISEIESNTQHPWHQIIRGEFTKSS